jgi:hypothetical protein
MDGLHGMRNPNLNLKLIRNGPVQGMPNEASSGCSMRNYPAIAAKSRATETTAPVNHPRHRSRHGLFSPHFTHCSNTKSSSLTSNAERSSNPQQQITGASSSRGTHRSSPLAKWVQASSQHLPPLTRHWSQRHRCHLHRRRLRCRSPHCHPSRSCCRHRSPPTSHWSSQLRLPRPRTSHCPMTSHHRWTSRHRWTRTRTPKSRPR